MLPALHHPPPWTVTGYVCRSCQLHLQRSRRLESTTAAAVKEAGKNGWHENLSVQSPSEAQAVQASNSLPTADTKDEGMAKTRRRRSNSEPRTRRLDPEAPAIEDFKNVPTTNLHMRLQTLRYRLENAPAYANPRDHNERAGGDTPAAAKRTTAFTRLPHQLQASIRSRIGLFERVVELRGQGILAEPSAASQSHLKDSTHPALRAPSTTEGLGSRPLQAILASGSRRHSLDRIESGLKALKSALAAKASHDLIENSNLSMPTLAITAPPVARRTAFSRLDRVNSHHIQQMIRYYERSLSWRRSTATTKETDALFAEHAALSRTLSNITGKQYGSPTTKTHPKELSRGIRGLNRLQEKTRKIRSSTPDVAPAHSERASELPAQLSRSSRVSDLDSLVAEIKEEFRERVEHSGNTATADHQRELAVDTALPRRSDRPSTADTASAPVGDGLRTDKANNAAAKGDWRLETLRDKLEREASSSSSPTSSRARKANREHEHQSLQGDGGTGEQAAPRVSTPRFAATPVQASYMSAYSSNARPTIAQKVREARERPKWGGSGQRMEGIRSALGGTSNEKSPKSTQKSRRSSNVQAYGRDKAASDAGFADSPADLAELQDDTPTSPLSMEPENLISTQSPGESLSDARSSAQQHATSPPELKGQSLSDLRASLTDAVRRIDQTPDGRARKAREERAQAIERNIRAMERSDVPAASDEKAVVDFHASESLARLHHASDSSPAEQEGASKNERPAETTKDKIDQSKREKPGKPAGGRTRPSTRAKKEPARGRKSVLAVPRTDPTGGDDGEHKPLWKVMQEAKQTPEEASAHEPATEPEPSSAKPEAPPLELPDGAPPSIARVKAADLHIDALEIPQPPVPGLEYGLDRALFNPGVYQLQDPISRVYNFDPYLQDIMPAVEFDFNALKEYKTSSEDQALSAIAKEHQKRYIGSTSSMTSTLAHFHYLLSNWRRVNLDMLSRGFTDQADEFTKINRAPNAIFLRWKPESKTYAIDADKEFDGANVLMMLGKSMEKMLTLPTSEFEKYRKSDPREVSAEARDEPEAFQYTTMGDFLMRSQLDAYDPRLPGNGMFDLKTRAVLSVRMDAEDFEPMLGYQIHTLQGRWNSYEREYYDMMRSTMLKYMLQARMGRMQGIFAAYHNIERIFGFQYIPMMDMDRALHGQIDPCLGDQEFKVSVELLNKVLNKATAKFPETSLRLHFETAQQNLGGESPTSVMSIFAEPMEEKEINRIQSLSKEKVREFEKSVMGIEEREGTPAKEASAGGAELEDQPPTEYPPATPEPSSEEPETTEPEPEEDSVPTTYPPTTPEPPTSSSSNPDLTSSTSAADSSFLSTLSNPKPLAPLFAATLIAKSRVNDEHVPRPSQLKPDDDWTVEYLLTEYPETEATWARYVATKARRKEVFARERDEDEDVAMSANEGKKAKKRDSFIEFLREMARRGREFREQMDKAEKGREKKVVWRKEGVVGDSTDVKADVKAGDGRKAAIEDVGAYMGWLYEERGRKV